MNSSKNGKFSTVLRGICAFLKGFLGMKEPCLECDDRKHLPDGSPCQSCASPNAFGHAERRNRND